MNSGWRRRGRRRCGCAIEGSPRLSPRRCPAPASRPKSLAEALGLEVTIEPDLREVSWGVHEGQPLAEWFHGWIAGHTAPEGAESFAELRRRSISGLNRAVSQPPAVLVVAHGGVFRAIRSVMKLEISGRTRNCVPMWCEPPRAPGLSGR